MFFKIKLPYSLDVSIEENFVSILSKFKSFESEQLPETLKNIIYECQKIGIDIILSAENDNIDIIIPYSGILDIKISSNAIPYRNFLNAIVSLLKISETFNYRR